MLFRIHTIQLDYVRIILEEYISSICILRCNGKFVSVSFFFSFPYLQIEVCARVCVRVAHTKKLHTLLVDLTYRGYLTSDQI